MPSSTNSRHGISSLPSTASLNRATSTKSNRPPPPPVTTVVTSPPWARDEPPSPSPRDQALSIDSYHPIDSRPSDVSSYFSNTSNPASRWWSFTLPRPREPLLKEMSNFPRPERKGFKGRSMSWLNTTTGIREASASRKEREKAEGHSIHDDAQIPDWNPQLPPLSHASTSDPQNSSPGWEIPWTPRAVSRGSHVRRANSYGLTELGPVEDQNKNLGVWARRRKKLRNFILSNTYVPLLFRFMNITFTTAALGMAIRIRRLELTHHAGGAVGSSPLVVIIFAPLTLVHVMAAIYVRILYFFFGVNSFIDPQLEYFGRPLGLWQTSAKLTHTLSEVLFICAWSAALSLCFDNFFTSLVPCASPSSIAWYNQLPRPASDAPALEHGVGERLCDDQLSLICLVGVGLLIYCTNLVISLFRIFEKVKYHPAALTRLP